MMGSRIARPQATASRDLAHRRRLGCGAIHPVIESRPSIHCSHSDVGKPPASPGGLAAVTEAALPPIPTAPGLRQDGPSVAYDVADVASSAARRRKVTTNSISSIFDVRAADAGYSIKTRRQPRLNAHGLTALRRPNLELVSACLRTLGENCCPRLQKAAAVRAFYLPENSQAIKTAGVPNRPAAKSGPMLTHHRHIEKGR